MLLISVHHNICVHCQYAYHVKHRCWETPGLSLWGATKACGWTLKHRMSMPLMFCITPAPRDGVRDLVGEVLEGADRDRLLRRVAGGAVVLREVGDHHLGVALGCAGAGAWGGAAMCQRCGPGEEGGLGAGERAVTF